MEKKQAGVITNGPKKAICQQTLEISWRKTMKILALGTFALSLVESNSNVGISGVEFFERVSVQEERALEKKQV